MTTRMDAHRWQGHLRTATPVPGHETCGTIVEMRGELRDILGEPLKVETIELFPRTHTVDICYCCRVARQTSLCPHVIVFGSSKPSALLDGCAEYPRGLGIQDAEAFPWSLCFYTDAAFRCRALARQFAPWPYLRRSTIEWRNGLAFAAGIGEGAPSHLAAERNPQNRPEQVPYRGLSGALTTAGTRAYAVVFRNADGRPWVSRENQLPRVPDERVTSGQVLVFGQNQVSQSPPKLRRHVHADRQIADIRSRVKNSKTRIQ